MLQSLSPNPICSAHRHQECDHLIKIATPLVRDTPLHTRAHGKNRCPATCVTNDRFWRAYKAERATLPRMVPMAPAPAPMHLSRSQLGCYPESYDLL